MKFLPVGFWGEHGAWALIFTSLFAGLVLARPPSWQAWLLVPAAALLTGTKGLAQVTRRTGRGWKTMASFALAGLACAVPAALAAPRTVAIVAALAGPFALLYFWFAASPRWTRSLLVEALGTLLMATAAPVAVSATRPSSLEDLVGLWAALGTLFLPGVLRARMSKDQAVRMRTLTATAAVLGLAVWVALVLEGLMNPWGLLAATVFLGDLWSVWALPKWRVRTLGLFFAVRYAAAALLLALAWRTLL